MRLERLRIEGLRIVEFAELEPERPISLITGANGAGKTSILEALHLLAYGRSFRSASRDVLIRRDASQMSVFAEVRATAGARVQRLGMVCSGSRYQAKIDGEPVPGLGTLLRLCPMVCFEPSSHALISGTSERRRRFLDWGLFHVEQDFADLWRQHQRALRQRNALLKRHADAPTLDPWDHELARSGTRLHEMRKVYVGQLTPFINAFAARLMPEAGAAEVVYRGGWRTERETLREALLAARPRDALLGHSTVGPHRANWDLAFDRLPQRESFSRGQEKLSALICVLAQAAHFSGRLEQWPLIALDDLASELDREHQQRVLQEVSACGAQVWITGTEAPAGMDALDGRIDRFHVEQGRVSRLV